MRFFRKSGASHDVGALSLLGRYVSMLNDASLIGVEVDSARVIGDVVKTRLTISAIPINTFCIFIFPFTLIYTYMIRVMVIVVNDLN